MNNVDKIRIHADKIELNGFQLETVLEYYNDPKVEDKDRFTETFCSAAYQQAVDDFIAPWNIRKMNNSMRSDIENGKHRVMMLSGEGGYSYSVGLSVLCKENCHELVILTPGSSIYGAVINEVVLRWPKGDYPTDPFSVENAGVMIGDFEVKARARIVKMEDPKDVVHNLFPRISTWSGKDPDNIYQILLGDKNNKLPGEEGYDATYIQTLAGVRGVWDEE